VAFLGFSGKVYFSQFLRGEDVDRAYQMADLLIMPSVSEPFGLVALEAMQNGLPVIASKQSGVAEVAPSIVTVDYWDTDRFAYEVTRVLNSPNAIRNLKTAGQKDLASITWDRAAEKLHTLYQQLAPRALALAPQSAA